MEDQQSLFGQVRLFVQTVEEVVGVVVGEVEEVFERSQVDSNADKTDKQTDSWEAHP